MDALTALAEAIAKAKPLLRGYQGKPHTVIRGGRAFKLKPRNNFTIAGKGGSADLMEAAGWSKKKLKGARKKPIGKALIKPGKPPFLKRVAFLLGAAQSERGYRIGRYLETRKRGKAIPGTRKPRKGTYTGVYATGVNKAGQEVDAVGALYAEIAKVAIPSINLPRKFSRLPRVGKPKNPFATGTSRTGRRVKRALGLHGALLAANQAPGKAVAAGAIGAKLAGPVGATAAFGATEAASIAASALLARSVARRGKVASYLARRSKRKTGLYKARGLDRFKHTVIHRGRAMKMDAPEPFRTSLKHSSRDLLEATGWSKKKLTRKPRQPKKD